MIRRMGNIHLGPMLMPAMGLIAFLFAMSFYWALLYPIAQGFSIILLVLILAELYILVSGFIDLEAHRDLPEVLSLGDENLIPIYLKNNSDIALHVELIDELPIQLQERDMSYALQLDSKEERTFRYSVRPKTRGEYAFGHIQLLVMGPLRLLKVKLSRGKTERNKVFPSIIQMKEFELMAFSRTATSDGVRKLRRLGLSYEFEQINNYVKGDDIRHINWKASARHGELMVNRFVTERSQSVYCVLCKNREMDMPFEGMSLLDHAVNTSLVVSNIALHKHDRIGLITYSDKIGATLRASRETSQLKRVMNALYNEKERETEADHELLPLLLRKIAPNRSLLFLFVNFESPYALERALPHLKLISKRHLLVVIFFRNTEIEAHAIGKAKDLREVHSRTIARKMMEEKEAMMLRLKQAQIQCILTEPDRLNMRTVEKYLELKSRGAI